MGISRAWRRAAGNYEKALGYHPSFMVERLKERERETKEDRRRSYVVVYCLSCSRSVFCYLLDRVLGSRSTMVWSNFLFPDWWYFLLPCEFSIPPFPISSSNKANVAQVTLIYATAKLKVGIEIFCRIVGGFLWEGKPLANNWFVGLGYTTILNGLSFSQDMKLCSYYFVCSNPER